MKRILRATIALVTALCLLPAGAVLAAAPARSITIHKISGNNVKMTKGTPREFTAKEGFKLSDGYTVLTGKDSYCWLRLDEESIIKMDKNTSVSISKTSSNKLSVSVLSGEIFADAETQKNGDTLEVRSGNTALSIRGTSFSVKCETDGRVVIVMITGSADVDGNGLPAGRTMTVTDDETNETKEYNLNETSMEELSGFLLDAILENWDALVENGIFTEEERETINEIRERVAEEEQPAPPPPPPPASGGGGGGGSSVPSAPTFTVTYNINYPNLSGETPPAPATLAAGSTFSAPSTFAAMEKHGMSLKGWSLAADSGEVTYTPGASVTMPEHNLELYAVWDTVAQSSSAGYYTLAEAFQSSTGTLSLLKSVTLNQSASYSSSYEEMHTFVVTSGATLTIGGALQFNGAAVENNGSIIINSGGQLTVQPGSYGEPSLSNFGSITARAFGRLTISNCGFNNQASGIITMEDASKWEHLVDVQGVNIVNNNGCLVFGDFSILNFNDQQTMDCGNPITATIVFTSTYAGTASPYFYANVLYPEAGKTFVYNTDDNWVAQ